MLNDSILNDSMLNEQLQEELMLIQEQEIWFDRGKEDAWAGRPKQPPEDPQAASFYDLGYSEGITQRPIQTEPAQ